MTTPRKENPQKGGRPSKYTDTLSMHICERIAAGEPLASIVDDPKIPAYGTIMRWIEQRPAFRERYVRARDQQADALADQITKIADKALGKSNEEVQASRLMVDARKWVAAKLKPKRYGDRVELEAGPSLAEFLKTL